MSYINILNSHGVSHAELQKRLQRYVTQGVKKTRGANTGIHTIDLGNNVVAKIENKKVTQRAIDPNIPLNEIFDVSFAQGDKKISENPDAFFNDFKPVLRSLSTVYISGNPLAFDFSLIGEKVRALIDSDLLESLLSGVEGTALSTAAIGDSNIPLQSIADTFAVINKYLTDQSERTGTGVQLKEIPYPDVNNTDENSTYQVLANTTGKPVGEENTEGVLQTYKLSTGDFFQLYMPRRKSAVSTSPLLYVRTVNSLSAEAWRPLLTKEKIESLIVTNNNVLSSKIGTLAIKTKPVYNVFLEEENSNGTPITSVNPGDPCYIGDGRIVYRNESDGRKLYIKSINDNSNGTPITSEPSYEPCYVGDGRIVYRNRSDGDKLYIKSINDTSNGTPITSVRAYYPCYVGESQIVYSNWSDGYKLYIKSINDTSTGTLINSVESFGPCYVGEGRIVYRNYSDDKLYIKSINDTSKGTLINSADSSRPCYVGDGRIVYSNFSAGEKLYIKSINDNSNGTPITPIYARYPCYVGDGRIVYGGVYLYIRNIDFYF